jgi:hypothetical protein
MSKKRRRCDCNVPIVLLYVRCVNPPTQACENRSIAVPGHKVIQLLWDA